MCHNHRKKCAEENFTQIFECNFLELEEILKQIPAEETKNDKLIFSMIQDFAFLCTQICSFRDWCEKNEIRICHDVPNLFLHQNLLRNNLERLAIFLLKLSKINPEFLLFLLPKSFWNVSIHFATVSKSKTAHCVSKKVSKNPYYHQLFSMYVSLLLC